MFLRGYVAIERDGRWSSAFVGIEARMGRDGRPIMVDVFTGNTLSDADVCARLKGRASPWPDARRARDD